MPPKYVSLSEQRFLFDTNIMDYWRKRLKFVKSQKKIQKKKKIVIYGAKVIRGELRKLPKASRPEGKRSRLVLLQLYDKVIKKQLITTDLAISLTKKYFNEYRKPGGIHNYNRFKNDFLIVALSSLYALCILL